MWTIIAEPSSQVWKFDPSKGERVCGGDGSSAVWSLVDVEGTPPQPARCCHTAVVVPQSYGHLPIFNSGGGERGRAGRGKKSSKSKGRRSSASDSNLGSGSGSGARAHRAHMLVWGGVGGALTCQIPATPAVVYALAFPCEASPAYEWIELSGIKGSAPPPRKNHSAVFFRGSMFVFGGDAYDPYNGRKSKGMGRDVWRLDLRRSKWIPVKAKAADAGDGPLPDARSCACLWAERKVPHIPNP